MDIGFIGLGIMGKPMAINLLKHGYMVRVRDINKEAECELEKLGALQYISVEEFVEKSNIIILMLPDSPNVENVVFGNNGLLNFLSPGKIIIDMSSINPEVSRKVGQLIGEKGCEFIDAPVSGGEPKAVDGTLSIMCGGKREVYNRVLPILKSVGTSVTWVGDIGSGNMCKLANQIIVAVNLAALAEALVFVRKSGGDPAKVFAAIRGGLAGSQVMDAKAPMMLSSNYVPGFRMELHVKDLKNALLAAKTVDMDLPLTDMVISMMKSLCQEGKEKYDHSALIQYYEEMK